MNVEINDNYGNVISQSRMAIWQYNNSKNVQQIP